MWIERAQAAIRAHRASVPSSAPKAARPKAKPGASPKEPSKAHRAPTGEVQPHARKRRPASAPAPEISTVVPAAVQPVSSTSPLDLPKSTPTGTEKFRFPKIENVAMFLSYGCFFIFMFSVVASPCAPSRYCSSSLF